MISGWQGGDDYLNNTPDITVLEDVGGLAQRPSGRDPRHDP